MWIAITSPVVGLTKLKVSHGDRPGWMIQGRFGAFLCPVIVEAHLTYGQGLLG
jgi:hypothetical protein